MTKKKINLPTLAKCEIYSWYNALYSVCYHKWRSQLTSDQIGLPQNRYRRVCQELIWDRIVQSFRILWETQKIEFPEEVVDQGKSIHETWEKIRPEYVKQAREFLMSVMQTWEYLKPQSERDDPEETYPDWQFITPDEISLFNRRVGDNEDFEGPIRKIWDRNRHTVREHGCDCEYDDQAYIEVAEFEKEFFENFFFRGL